MGKQQSLTIKPEKRKSKKEAAIDFNKNFFIVPHIATIKTTYEGQAFDTMLHAMFGRMTGWTSPASFGLAIYDWLAHLQISPAKQVDLMRKAVKNIENLGMSAFTSSGLNPFATPVICIKPKTGDHRFKAKEWDVFPFNLYEEVFLLCERWFDEATTSVRGVSKHHEDVVNFAARQMLDMLSPSNFPFTNPEIIKSTIQEGGMNFVNGFYNFIEDVYRSRNNLAPAGSEKFEVGMNLAITPGKVIYRNNLIELIQYEPTTSEVYAEPILIIPAWIMKYYILDLSQHNSLVKYLVDHGHTVFMISWKNPDSDERNMGLDDYINLGIMSSISAINQIIPEAKIHAAGYCLGGTLLMIAAAAMAHLSDNSLKTLTLFAAQIDFRDPGEMSFFIDPSQVTYLEDIMWEKGYLDGVQMANTFSMLRSNDLIWSRMIHDYLLGKRRPLNDLMAWDNDTTRLPFRMHSEYLRNLFLNNDLVHGRYKVGRRRVALVDISEPIFVVATIKDHVSPWRSVYKIHLYTNTQTTFVLTNGGHNAGIISEPGHEGRMYQMATHDKGDKQISSDTWHENAPKYIGSWWPAWENWLASHSSGKTNPPPIGNPKADYPVLCDAPGTYVMEK